MASVGIALASSARAQPAAPFTCIATSNPVDDRAQGVTELVGDVVISCAGGTPTPAGVPIPQANFTIGLNTNITSRLMPAGGVTEAILAIDEPLPGAMQAPPSSIFSGFPGVATAQLGCIATNTTNCAINGTDGGFGATGPYNGSPGHPNIFQGVLTDLNHITWTGVPIDPPGTAVTRIIRITNVRANARLLGVACTLVQSVIFEFISVSGMEVLALNNPELPVGFILPDLVIGTSPSGDVSAGEGFASAFKPRNFAQYGPSINPSGSATVLSPVPSASANGLQNVLGFNYNSESGFVTNAAGLIGDGTTPGAMGLADSGAELAFRFTGPANGTVINVPNVIYLYRVGTAVTAATGATGATGVAVLMGAAFSPGTTTPFVISSGSATATYEVLLSDPFTLEFAFLPSPGAGVTTSVSLAPSASNITYEINQKVGVGSVTGIIVTDGTIGVLGQGNIVAYDLLINDGTDPPLELNSSSVTRDVFLNGSDLSATATQLLFNFSGTDHGIFGIIHPSGDFGFCFNAGTPSGCFTVGGGAPGPGESVRGFGTSSIPPVFNSQFTSLSGSQVIGTLSTAAPPIPRFIGTSVCPALLPTTEVSVTASGLLYSHVTRTLNGTLTIKNISAATINGPLEIAFAAIGFSYIPNNLTSFSGVIGPYITLPAPNLVPGESATIKVQAFYPQFVLAPPGSRISFTPIVFSGGF